MARRELMKRLREAPTSSGRPKLREFVEPRQRGHALLGRLAEADAGIEHDVGRRAMPALAAMSSERAKKADMSAMMSMAGSTWSRLCITITGQSRSAASVGHVGIALQAPDVVGDRARRSQARMPTTVGFHAVDRDGDAERDDIGQHRSQAFDFLLGGDRLAPP